MDEIKKEDWHTCRLCDKKIKDLAKVYGGSGVYYTQVFKKHLKSEHSITVEDYFAEIIPVCPCGTCNKPCRIGGVKNPNYNFYMGCGFNEGVKEWSEKAKITRKGSGNPMYNKTPWNNGQTKETHASVMKSSISNTGKIIPDEAKAKMSESAKKRLVHGHTGHKHSEAARKKMSESTIRRMKNGDFKHTITKPHIKMCSILTELDISYEEEYNIGHWLFDIYIPEYNLLIEVDGDYFHSNPKIYPNGPQTKTQKINYARDISKNNFCIKNNLTLLRFWECDILQSSELIKEKLCNLRKSYQSEKSESQEP